MSINTSWEIKIGSVASPTNFTSRVLSMNIQQSVDVNVIGTGICQITLLNKDGALTPGGGGTYSSTDWFAEGVFVSALTNVGGADTNTPVFHGVVTNFTLVDDGVFSTVTITALDGLTVAGRAVPAAIPIAVNINYVGAITNVLSNVGRTYVQYPKLGKTVGVGAYTNLGDGDERIETQTTTFNSAADLLQTAFVPSANDVMWPTTITESGINASYTVVSLPFYNTRSVLNTVDLEFAPSGFVSGTKLPFSAESFTQSFNNDTLISTAIIKGLKAGLTEQSESSANITTYGSRTVAFTSTFSESDIASDTMASKLVTRYGTSRFTPTSLSVTASMIKSQAASGAHSRWYNLLSITSGIWQKATITWTGSGASSQTAESVIKGRTINVTPADTEVILFLGNWLDNHSFILNSDKLNVNFLG